jgi:RND family efflux transporter MFP subunit
VLEQRARVQDLENRLATLPARRDAARQETRVAEADLEMAELDLDRTEIRAPFDARVASADVQIRQFVATGAEIAVLDGVARAEIAAQIPPSRMAGFVRLAADGRFDGAPQRFSAVGERLELSATVRLAGGAGRRSWQADVARISDTVDPETRSVGVVVTVDDPYGRILPGERPPLIKGMFTRVELTAPAVADRLVVPRSAVREGRVMVVDEDSRLAFAPVEVVYTQGDVAVLAGGLSPGTRVVVSDPTPAIEGMLLSPSPSEDAAARIAADIAAPAEGR